MRVMKWLSGLALLFLVLVGAAFFWMDVGRWQFEGVVARHFLNERSGDMPIFKVDLDSLKVL